jgi:hypothetical protein
MPNVTIIQFLVLLLMLFSLAVNCFVSQIYDCSIQFTNYFINDFIKLSKTT